MRICNAWLSLVLKEEEERFEKNKDYFLRMIASLEQEIIDLKLEKKRIIKKISDTIEKLEERSEMVKEISKLENLLLTKTKQNEEDLSYQNVRLKEFKEKLESLMPAQIISFSIYAKDLTLPKELGIILSGFIGLICGIGIVFMIEYLQFRA